MTKQPKAKLNRLILDEASDWFVDFRVGDVDSAARERFDGWLRQSPEHIRAYMEIAKSYVVLPALDPNRKVDIQELIEYARSDGNVVPIERAPQGNRLPLRVTEPQAEPPSKRSSPRATRRVLAAASMATACIAAGLLAWMAFQRYLTYATDIGERRTVTLSDGSTIDLNARAKMRVKFSQGERDVELIEGQALFDVAKDKARPFIVHTGPAMVRVVGTKFDVYRKRSSTTVTVIEGRVAVFSSLAHDGPSDLSGASPPDRIPSDTAVPQLPESKESAGQPHPVFVSAGQQVTVTESRVPPPKEADVATTTAWTHHQLVFDGSRLSDVIDEFNRYNTRQIVIQDRVLDDFHVSGVYSSTDPASLIRFLRAQPGIEVFETDERVRIGRK